VFQRSTGRGESDQSPSYQVMFCRGRFRSSCSMPVVMEIIALFLNKRMNGPKETCPLGKTSLDSV